MGKRLIMVPDGWPCTLEDCPPGIFTVADMVFFKSEYKTELKDNSYRIDAFNLSGEYLSLEFMDKIKEVQPVICSWIKEDY